MDTPFLRVEDSGEVISLRGEVTTVGRGRGVDIHLDDPSVSRLHAELVRRGPYVYVVDLGLSRNGTRVNGRPVARRVLDEGDVLSFGAARCRIGGIPREDLAEEAELRRAAAPELTRRELDVLTSLCRPALSEEAFAMPATAHEIATDLVVTEAAVKQHLLRLYQKFRVPEGPNRRTRLANEVVALGLVKPLPLSEAGGPGGQPQACRSSQFAADESRPPSWRAEAAGQRGRACSAPGQPGVQVADQRPAVQRGQVRAHHRPVVRGLRRGEDHRARGQRPHRERGQRGGQRGPGQRAGHPVQLPSRLPEPGPTPYQATMAAAAYAPARGSSRLRVSARVAM